MAGRPVARIGFGAMQLPGPGVLGPPRERDTALAVLRRAIELGVKPHRHRPVLRPRISSVSLDQLRQALQVGLACVQNAYSLVDRSGEPLLALCRAHDVPWVPYFPLGSAFPGLPKVTEQPEVVVAASLADLDASARVEPDA